jgi:hypothetical protein
MVERLQLVAVAVMAAVWGLVAFARRRPDLDWLEPVRRAFPRSDEQQRARQRRRADFNAGFQFLLLGIVVPLVVGVLKLAFFQSFSATELVVVFGISALCFALGAAGIRSSRRR